MILLRLLINLTFIALSLYLVLFEIFAPSFDFINKWGASQELYGCSSSIYSGASCSWTVLASIAVTLLTGFVLVSILVWIDER